MALAPANLFAWRCSDAGAARVQVMAGVNISATAEHHTPALVGLTLSDVNYIANCYLHPEKCV
eukprot:4631767-Prymnesium_polylepis.1